MFEPNKREVQMGIGDAILRLMRIEAAYSNGLFTVPEHLKSEREMIVEQLNQYTLDMGFDCNDDNVPDTVEIFKQTAETSCCRILPRDTSRKVPETSAPIPPIAVEATTLGIPAEEPVPVVDAEITSPGVVAPPIAATATPVPVSTRRDSSRRKS